VDVDVDRTLGFFRVAVGAVGHPPAAVLWLAMVGFGVVLAAAVAGVVGVLLRSRRR